LNSDDELTSRAAPRTTNRSSHQTQSDTENDIEDAARSTDELREFEKINSLLFDSDKEKIEKSIRTRKN
jgi:hypothetical protein